MTRIRTIGTRAALGGFTAAVALMTAQPAARADEVADLKANQELLQQRVDQLAQAQVPGNLYGVGGPARSGQRADDRRQLSALVPDPRHRHLDPGRRRNPHVDPVLGHRRRPEHFPSTNAGTTGQLNNIPLYNNKSGRTSGQDIS